MHQFSSFQLLVEQERRRREVELGQRAREARLLLDGQVAKPGGRSRLLAHLGALLVSWGERLQGEQAAQVAGWGLVDGRLEERVDPCG